MTDGRESPGKDAGAEDGDEQWRAFVAEFEKEKVAEQRTSQSGIGRPSGEQCDLQESSAARPKRVWPRVLAAVVGATAISGVLWWTGATRWIPAWNQAATAAAPAASAKPARSARATPAASSSTESAALSPIPPSRAFPDAVPGPSGEQYTKVDDIALPDCTELQSFSASLAAAAAQIHGCRAMDIALYKDAENNQFNLVLVTMQDPASSAALFAAVHANPAGFPVKAQRPPTGSGLPPLGVGTLKMQTFISKDRVFIVGTGQWANGSADRQQQLTDLLNPLTVAVAKQASVYYQGQ